MNSTNKPRQHKPRQHKTMLILVFDTETTGLPKTRNKTVHTDDLHLWPHIVQFSYLIYSTKNKNIIKIVDHIVKLPHGVEIEPVAESIHGISKKISQTQGKEINTILQEFIKDVTRTDIIVCHNLQFDINVMKAELFRILDQDKSFQGKEREQQKYKYDDFLERLLRKDTYCSMMSTIDLCSIKRYFASGKSYNKFPKLSELHSHLFDGCVPKNLHNSLNDVLVCLRCYYKLVFQKDICNEDEAISSLMRPLLSS